MTTRTSNTEDMIIDSSTSTSSRNSSNNNNNNNNNQQFLAPQQQQQQHTTTAHHDDDDPPCWCSNNVVLPAGTPVLLLQKETTPLQQHQQQQPSCSLLHTTTTASSSSSSSTTLLFPFFSIIWKMLLFILVLSMTLKILLIPSYRSTDFDVHRNWLAITRHLPLSQWYFDDINGTTVHTLDYPPSFAFFEYFLSNNFITDFLIQSGILNEQCFQLLGDDENDVGMDCVVFQRLTVVLVGDMVYWWGILAMMCSCHWIRKEQWWWWWWWWWCTATRTRNTTSSSSRCGSSGEQEKHVGMDTSMVVVVVVITLAVFNSGLILLDHVHFQYNGMLLGILLLSISFVLRSMEMTTVLVDPNSTVQNKGKSKMLQDNYLVAVTTAAAGTRRRRRREIIGSLLFAWLVTFKHLYITLGPVYFFYMLGRVIHPRRRPTSMVLQGGMLVGDDVEGGNCWWHQIKFLFLLAISVFLTIMLPFLPFLASDFMNWKGQLMQILSRLFPFHQRGLCHDYWAGNVWALYKFAEKFYNKFLVISPKNGAVSMEVTPLIAAVCLLVALVPVMICSWKIARNTLNYCPHQRQKGFIYCIVYASLSSFMLSYHVHEKAIMTAIVPMIFLSVTDKTSAKLFLRMSTLGHFGLLPLLYKPTELLLKVFLHSCYLMLSISLLEKVHNAVVQSGSSSTMNGIASIPVSHPLQCSCSTNHSHKQKGLINTFDKIGLGVMALILFYTEFVHFMIFGHDRMEFLPLLITSVFCAVGLIGCWIQCGKVMFNVTSKTTVAATPVIAA